MKQRAITVILSLVFCLGMGTVGYGFWTDHLDVEANAKIHISLPVIDDIADLKAEDETEAATPAPDMDSEIKPVVEPPKTEGSGNAALTQTETKPQPALDNNEPNPAGSVTDSAGMPNSSGTSNPAGSDEAPNSASTNEQGSVTP